MPRKVIVSSGRTGFENRTRARTIRPGSPTKRETASTAQPIVHSPWRIGPPSPAAWPASASMWIGL